MHRAGYTMRSFFLFFLKRLSRLEPPYILSIILALTVLYLREKWLGKANDHMNISVIQVALHFGYLIPFFEGYKWLNQVYWTLAVEFQFYFFIALLYVPLVKFGLLFRLLVYTVLIASTFLGSAAFLPYWLPFFLLGILLFLFKAELIKEVEFYFVLGGLLLFCCYRYPIMSVFYASIPVLIVLRWPDRKFPILHGLGKFSYSIYLIHPLIGASLINILSHSFSEPFEKFLVILAGLSATILASWLTYLIIERPSRMLSSSIKYKGSGSGSRNGESVEGFVKEE